MIMGGGGGMHRLHDTLKLLSSAYQLNSLLFPSGLKPETQAPYRSTSAGPHPRSFQEATRAQKPPVAISDETVSKRVLSARYQPIKVDDIMAKAGTLT